MSRQDLSPSLKLGPLFINFEQKWDTHQAWYYLNRGLISSYLPTYCIWLKPCFNCSMFCIVFVLECCEMVSFSRSSCPLVCTHLLCARRPDAGQRWSDLCFVFLLIFLTNMTQWHVTPAVTQHRTLCVHGAKFWKSPPLSLSFRDRGVSLSLI